MKTFFSQHRLTSLAKFAIGLVVIPVAITMFATGSIASAHTEHTVNLGDVRGATARFHNVGVAKAAKYAVFPDAAGILCIDNPGVGAMGIHYVNGDLVGSGQINPLTPQALVYEPEDNGQLRLVAVEYITFQAAWDTTHNAPPSLFGQRFMLTPDGNRFGIPAFYSLHAWIWKHNPSGTFAMFNPSVNCSASPAA